MDLILEFRDGRISGEGSDGIGPFAIAGEYGENPAECSWIKTYLGRHSVAYVGFGEGKGIWGTWDVMGSTGGFHIWPIGQQLPFDSTEEEEPLAETERIYRPVEARV